MTESDRLSAGLGQLAQPDYYTLELPDDAYEDVSQRPDGRLMIKQTPEQREDLLAWIENEVLD
jgi:hypothetical protein